MAMRRSGNPDAAEKMNAPAHQENEKRKRILVVEDNPLSLALLKQLLKVHGYEYWKPRKVWRRSTSHTINNLI